MKFYEIVLGSALGFILAQIILQIVGKLLEILSSRMVRNRVIAQYKVDYPDTTESGK